MGRSKQPGTRLPTKNLKDLTFRQWLLLAEAIALLTAAWIATRVIPFPILARHLESINAKQVSLKGIEHTSGLAQIAWALRAIGRKVPMLKQCLVQGIAARWMLSRRHCANTLCLGVQKDEAGLLRAHAWVQAGHRTVVGGTGAEYRIIATFGEAVKEGRPYAA